MLFYVAIMGRGEVLFFVEECCAVAFAWVSFCCSKCDFCGDVERVLEVGIAYAPVGFEVVVAAPFHGDVFRASITHTHTNRASITLSVSA